MDPQQQFCLKWNSYSSNLAMTFSNLFKSELLADVTLFCGGKLHITYEGLHLFPLNKNRAWARYFTIIHLSIRLKIISCLDKVFQTEFFFLYLCALQFSFGFSRFNTRIVHPSVLLKRIGWCMR